MKKKRKLQASNRPASNHHLMLCVVVVVLSVWVTFGRVLTHEFVGGWDDGPLIVDNELVNPPTGEGLVRIWAGPHARMYIPAVYTTWWMLAKVATVPRHDALATDPWVDELNPFVFHAANLIVHTLSAVIVFALLRRLIRRDWAAVAGAVLFAIHPLQVEPVAWATGMKDLLGGMLSLAAMWQYLAFTTTTDAKRRRVHMIAASAAFGLALLAKPSAVVTPFILLTIEWLLLGRSLARAAGVLLPWMVVAVVWMLVTSWAQPTPEMTAPPVVSRVLIAGNALGFYLVKLFWPVGLGVDYGLRPDLFVRSAYLIATIVVAAAVVASRKRWLMASAAVFAIALTPTLGLKPFVFQWVSTVADRYAYIALLGPAMAVAILLCEMRQKPVAWIATAVMVALALLSNAQARVWRDNRSLMTHALRINPDSAPANAHIGDLLVREGKFAEAHDRFATAVRVSPGYLNARDNLAGTLAVMKRYDEALALMKQTLAMKEALPAAIRPSTERDRAMIERVERLRGGTTEPVTP